MSTTFNFPANPAIGDQFTLPNGTISQWNGSEWVSVDNSNISYPLALALGGTGAATAPQARINLGLNTATGEFIVQKDGTATLPGIAFASEPGLGWYRNGAQDRRFAAQGTAVETLTASNAALTSLFLTPRAAGVAQHILRNQVIGSANFNQLQLAQLADGSALIGTGVGGSATRGNLTLDAPDVYTTGTIHTNGSVALNAGNVVVSEGQITVAATGTTGGMVQLAQNGVASRFIRSISANIDFINASFNATTHQFDNAGNAAKAAGGTSWIAGISDARMKEDIEDYTEGLDAVLRLRPRRFRFKPESKMTTESRLGMIEQETRGVLPSVPSMMAERLGIPDLKSIDESPVAYLLINAIKTLDQRLKAIGA